MASKIEWTGSTWNPIVGCSVVSPGCTSCYAMRLAARLARMGQERYAGLTTRTKAGPVWTGEMRLVESALDLPLRTRKPTTWFVNSMSDLFHENVPDEWIDRVFAVMALCPQHTFQCLTKRSARMRAYVTARHPAGCASYKVRVCQAIDDLVPLRTDASRAAKDAAYRGPLPNVWLGVSAEDQRRADERVPDLLATPAAIRFVSAEPLLGPIDFEAAWHGDSALEAECWGECAWCSKGLPPLHNCQRGRQTEAARQKGRSGLEWIIVGGESGPGARPFVLGWAKDIVRQCQDAGVSVFVKQIGAKPTDREGGRHPTKDRKGGDMAEWPESIRVREMPAEAVR